jgi:hypothetical protein
MSGNVRILSRLVWMCEIVFGLVLEAKWSHIWSRNTLLCVLIIIVFFKVQFTSLVSQLLQSTASLYSLTLMYSTANLKLRMAYFILFYSILVLLQMLLNTVKRRNSLIRNIRRVLQSPFYPEVGMKIWVKFIIQENVWNCIRSNLIALQTKGANWHFQWRYLQFETNILVVNVKDLKLYSKFIYCTIILIVFQFVSHICKLQLTADVELL